MVLRAPDWIRKWRRVLDFVMKALDRTRLIHFHMVILGALPALRLSVMRVNKNTTIEMKRAIAAYSMIYETKGTEFAIEALRCDHMTEDGTKSSLTRSGNRDGKYCKCTRCGRKWTYNDKEKSWEITHAGRSSHGSSASCSRLPPPSSADTRTAPPSRAREKPPAKDYVDPKPKRASRSSQRRPELLPTDLNLVINIYTDEEEASMGLDSSEEESYSWSESEEDDLP